uniref:DNA-directed primase/polymerase protein n=1 Tax=Leptobrachium leishanense TaxID=445787 RepID=A0A8C5LGL0_9ANUR
MKRKWLDKIKKVEELAVYYKRHPISLAYKPKLANPWQPSSVWKLFPRLALAFNFAKTCKEDVHVFALETVIEDTERRLFLVTTYTEFWFYYLKHPKSLAHCYEVIPADTVCKLYFDLEFYKAVNPSADGVKMVTFVIEFFSKKLEESYGIECSAECVLNLDSSSDDKFSRHLIFVLPNAAFKDNIHVGNFIKSALQPVLSSAELKCNRPGSERGVGDISSTAAAPAPDNTVTASSEHRDNSNRIQQTESDLYQLIVNDKQGGKQLFIDLGVYTNNRNFRLYKSSKLGKDVFFDVARDNNVLSKPEKNVSAEEHIFLRSLISNVRFSDSLKILKCASSGSEKSSPACIGTRNLSPSGLRAWNYFFLEELLIYDIVNYRFCENIGRPHKSNNVMFVVDLKNEVWYQKCHDPVCKAQKFKSDYYPLPHDICLPSLLKEEVEECFITMDENGNIKESTPLRFPNERPFSEQCNTPRPEESERQWEDEIDDASLLQAAEDIEFADAVDLSLTDWNDVNTEIPDKLMLEALDELNTKAQR